MGSLARAASHFGFAVWILTHQFTLGLGAFRLIALPVATRVFANCFAFRFWCLSLHFKKKNLAMSHAMGLFADSHALGTVFSLAGFIGAFNLICMSTSQSGFSHFTSQTEFLGS